jgi:hypothetical protein
MGFCFSPLCRELPQVDLQPHTVEAIDRYMRPAETQPDKQAHSASFLWVDGLPDRKMKAQRGEAVAAPAVG